jgi:acyl carrier protein
LRLQRSLEIAMTTDPIPVLLQFIATELLSGDSAAALQPTSDLLVEGGLDSMGVVRLTAFLEQRFQMRVPPEDVTLENFQTLQAIADYVARQKGSTST